MIMILNMKTTKHYKYK